MFDYSYWPEGLSIELNKQMMNFHHKAQLLVDGATFLELGNNILKAQMGDKFLELIVFLPKGYRTLEIANLLHRLVQAGSKVGLFDVDIFDQELEQFAVFDSKLLISNKLPDLDKGIFQLLLQKHSDFERIMNNSLLVSFSFQEIKMKFLANRYFVSKGGEVELSWKVENANSILLNPGNAEVEAEGSIILLIEKDTLFTITSRNAKNQNILSIFIKSLDDEQLDLLVSVYQREISDYIKIDSISKREEVYAVYKGDLLRVEWACKSDSSLSEAGLGKLKNVGFYNFIASENRQFDFQLQLPNRNFKKELKIYPFTEEGLISKSHILDGSNSKPRIQLAKFQLKSEILRWVRNLFGKIKINRKNVDF